MMAQRGVVLLTRSNQRSALLDACRRFMSSKRETNKPLHPNVMCRPGGIATFMRLPYNTDPTGLDVAFIGIPIDHGASNRSGARFGPKQIRQESNLLKEVNSMTKAMPFENLQVADIGDVPVNLFSLEKTAKIIRDFYADILSKSPLIPMTLGGDHTVSYPIIQALAEKHGPVALVHVDAHLDTADHMFGMKIAHGTPFKRCYDENILQTDKVYQFGIRGSSYSMEDVNWPIKHGFHVYPADQLWHKSLVPLMEEVRQKLAGQPVYLSFDIDALDPAYAPGTGTPETAGLTPIQAIEIIRGCRGLNLVGCDLVEVAPAYDPHGTTALVGANLLFEMLCVLPGVHYAE